MDVRAPSPPARPIRKSICRRMRLHGCRFSENGHKRTGRFHIRPRRAQCAESGKSSRARRLQSLKRGRTAMLRKGAGAECRFQNRIAAREFRTFRYVVFLGGGSSRNPRPQRQQITRLPHERTGKEGKWAFSSAVFAPVLFKSLCRAWPPQLSVKSPFLRSLCARRSLKCACLRRVCRQGKAAKRRICRSAEYSAADLKATPHK